MANQNNLFSQKGNQKNSVITLMEQVSLLNKNSTEIISKFNDALSSDQSSVSVKMYNQDGTYTNYEMPTIGEFKSQIDVANTNIKRLAGLEGSTYIFDGKSSKKVFAADINREPAPIQEVDSVIEFGQNNNWFFEELMNPIISVKLDLSQRVNDSVDSILSRRYIVKFKVDDVGYTVEGLNSLEDFNEKFLNKTDISIENFESWLSNPTNVGVTSNLLQDNMDEQQFDLSLRTLRYKGTFSVIKSESDTLNNKLWYHLDTLRYFTTDGRSAFLAIDDQLVINSKISTTRYKIVEISTANSLNRISVERIEGYDAIPIGTNVLEFYSELVNDKNVKITIGFNEHIVMFVKPINTETGVLGSTWSKGTGFYSNDLVLDTDNSKDLLSYYYATVYDYGRLLKDLVKKIIPVDIGTEPNEPVILTENFKVVQINKHLTDTKDADELRDLHSQKNGVRSKLDEVNTALLDKSKELNTRNYRNVADKTKAKNEYDKLVLEQESNTKLFGSVVAQITNSKSNTKNVTRKYRIRGFWNFPEPIIVEGYRPQQVIGFEYQYRYSNKTGNETPIEAIKMTQQQDPGGTSQASTTASSAQASAAQPTTYAYDGAESGGLQTSDSVKKSTGYFSNWVSIKTDIRKRTFNAATEEWYWNLEDISDADTPNINQVDIAINLDEKVDIRIRSISEVGYPDSIMYSDWSDIITVEFPDDLDDVVDENDFILKEASQEEVRVQFENELASRGVVKHIQQQFYDNDNYYGHSDNSIATNFKDSFGEFINLRDYIKSLTTRIDILEEKVNRAKGRLSVSFFKGTTETILAPNTETTILVECEDYGEASGTTRTYFNVIYVVKDYYLKFSNVAAENDLGLFSNRSYTDTVTEPSNSFFNNPLAMALFVDDNDYLLRQSDYQYLWFSDNYNSATDYIYKSGSTEAEQYDILTTNFNYGTGDFLSSDWTEPTVNVLTDIAWSGASDDFASSIHPVVSNRTDIVEQGQAKTKIIAAQNYFTVPINIYFKFSMDGASSFEIPFNTVSTPELVKRLKIFVEPENESRALEFKLKFRLKRNKTATYYNTSSSSQSSGGGVT